MRCRSDIGWDGGLFESDDIVPPLFNKVMYNRRPGNTTLSDNDDFCVLRKSAITVSYGIIIFTDSAGVYALERPNEIAFGDKLIANFYILN